MIELESRPALTALVGALLDAWPEHRRYVERSFESRPADTLDVSEDVSGLILALSKRLSGGLTSLCADYRYLCDVIVMPEEIHFRRHGRYRLSSFADANRECYANPPMMNRYMNGLLLSNVFWDNHARVFSYFARDYLGSLPAGASLLEIGPGHGLFLFFAARRANRGAVTGWDISETSVANTREALRAMTLDGAVDLAVRDWFAPDNGDTEQFDAIVLSEILEHLEDPVGALHLAHRRLKPGGTVFVNVPANSPAPDHIYLVNSPEHAAALAVEAGFEIVDSAAFPMTGATLDRARKQKLAISCVVVGRRLQS
jgi:SAM-dependent methyltransferase